MIAGMKRRLLKVRSRTSNINSESERAVLLSVHPHPFQPEEQIKNNDNLMKVASFLYNNK